MEGESTGMNGLVTRLAQKWTQLGSAACLVALSGAACAQVTPLFGLGTYHLADVVDPVHGLPGTASTQLGRSAANDRTNLISEPGGYYSIEPTSISADAAYGFPDDERASGQDRSWGVTFGVEYGALTLRAAHQNRHVTDIRLFDQTGVSFDAKNSIAAANYRMGWGTAYAAYSASRGWGNSPLYNPDNPYSANIAGTTSNDTRDMLAGVAVPITHSTTFLASYIHKNDREFANRDANQLAIGASYTLSARTDFYAAYSHIRNINSGSYLDPGNRASNSAINIGMRHAF